MNNPVEWNASEGIAICRLKAPDGYIVCGEARCAPQDRDMMSEKTGCAIAHMRASIALSKYIRDSIIAPELNALKQFYCSINLNKHFDPTGYVEKALHKRIVRLTLDINELRTIIKQQQRELHNYLTVKEKLYNKIRTMRTQDKNS